MSPIDSNPSAGEVAAHPARGHIARRIVRKFFVLSVISVVGLIVLSFTAIRPDHLGPNSGKLAPVPDSPNCVSTMTDKPDFLMEPLDVSGLESPMEALKDLIGARFSRAKLVVDQGDYLHYEFTSLIFRFTDDVEFLLDEANSKIHFRSASRVGYSDMGANRKRMERIRAAFAN